jgi:hypothetical protein
MSPDERTFTIALPELRKYKILSIAWRLLFLVFWILLGVTSFGNFGLSREIVFIITGVALCLSLGFAFYSSREQKTLRLLINQRFAEEFRVTTGHEYPSDIDILEVKQSIAVRNEDGAVRLWGVHRSFNQVVLTPITNAPR